MAKATATNSRPSITLELSFEEASMLYWVLRKISGDPNESARKYQASVSGALNGLGLNFQEYRISGQIDFANEPGLNG